MPFILGFCMADFPGNIYRFATRKPSVKGILHKSIALVYFVAKKRYA